MFIPQRRLAVDYGKISQLDAELGCMRELFEHSTEWRYLINLTGQEFPLKTMWQLVRILRALNGSNSVEALLNQINTINSNRRDELMPFAKQYNITPVKGQTHLVVTRGYVKYILYNHIAVDMLEWLRRVDAT